MSLEDCAARLGEQDPDRLGICLLAPATARPRLLTLYALNLELARAPLASNEPLIAEMRLQWWVDRFAEIGAGRMPRHDLLTALAEAWGPENVPQFAALAEARRGDCLHEPHEGPDAVIEYVRASALPLTRLAAEALDVPEVALPAISAHAEGVGLARWLGALPELQGRGLGLRDPAPAALGQIAARARAALAEARSARRSVPRRVAPVLFAGAGAGPALAAAPQGLEALAAAQPSEFRRRLALGAFVLTHRWWM